MKVLVVGASGQVGRRLMKLLARHEVTGTGHKNAAGLIPLDLADGEAVRRLVASLRPQTIFVPGGVTAVDWCEDHADEARRICVDGSRALQQAADAVGAHAVHFSTDYVFPGGAGPYRESDRPDPLSAYGRIKLEGENAVRESKGRWTILRTSMVYSVDPGGKNFAQFVFDKLRSGGRVQAFSDQTGTPTHAPDLAAAAVEAAEKGVTGLWHATGPEVLTRLDFARKVARAFDLPVDRIDAVTSDQLVLKARRPGLKAGLATAGGRLATPMARVDEALRQK